MGFFTASKPQPREQSQQYAGGFGGSFDSGSEGDGQFSGFGAADGAYGVEFRGDGGDAQSDFQFESAAWEQEAAAQEGAGEEAPAALGGQPEGMRGTSTAEVEGGGGGAGAGAGGAGSDGDAEASATVSMRDLLSTDNRAAMDGWKKHEGQQQAFLYGADAQGAAQRPWSDKMVFYTGCSVLAGAGLGGMFGAVEGLRAAKGDSARIRLNSVLNSCGRRGATLSHLLGALSLSYAFAGYMSSFVRDEDDGINSAVVAAAVGGAYKVAQGPQTAGKWAIACAAGFSAANYADVRWRRSAQAK